MKKRNKHTRTCSYIHIYEVCFVEKKKEMKLFLSSRIIRFLIFMIHAILLIVVLVHPERKKKKTIVEIINRSNLLVLS